MKRVCCLLLVLVLMILCASCDFAPQESKFYWIPEESFFVDYEITENKTVRFRYSIALVNDYDASVTASVSAKFKENETSGWLKETDFLMGRNEEGTWYYVPFEAGEKKNVIFVFEGSYAGGQVNENLSFPELLYMLDW